MTGWFLFVMVLIQAEVCLILWLLRSYAKLQKGQDDLIRELIAAYAKVAMIKKLPEQGE